VRYTGSKWRIAPWVIRHFPPHVCYVEPFCGGAAVLFRKPPSAVEVINDLNQEVTNFFDMRRDCPAELIRAIELTPYSRFERERAMLPGETPLERARRFYIRAKQSYSAGESPKPRGWRFEINRTHGTLIDEWNKVSHLSDAAQRLKQVMIECDTSLEVIQRWDSPVTLFYCDPPYVSDTRTTQDYPDEMTDADHIALSEALHSIQGMAVISGYDSALYQRLYADWKHVTMEARTVNNVKRMESLWISPRATAAMGYGPLFAAIPGGEGV
jgi:DNA adenine methylase